MGLVWGWNASAVKATISPRPLADPRGRGPRPGAGFPRSRRSPGFGLFVAICLSQTGSLFSSDAWNNITFTAGEVKEPRGGRSPSASRSGTVVVIGLYLLANVAYLVTTPSLQGDPGRPRATAWPRSPWSGSSAPGRRPTIMAGGHHGLDFRVRERARPGGGPGLLRHGAGRPLLLARAGRAERRAGAGLGPGDPGPDGRRLLVLPRTYNADHEEIREPLRRPPGPT